MALALQKQWDYYLSKEEEFLKNCYGKFVVINDKLEVVVMDTIGDAYKLGCVAYGLGNFLIQEAVEQRPTYARGFVCPDLAKQSFEKTKWGYIVRPEEKGENGNG